MTKVVVVLHDVSSQARMIDFIKVVIAFAKKIGGVVISKPSGAGAMYGVPEASKILYRESIPLIVLPDIKDIREVFQNKKIVFVSLGEYTKKRVKSINDIDGLSDSILVFPGSDNGFSKKELLEADEIIYPVFVDREIPAEATLAILFSSLID